MAAKSKSQERVATILLGEGDVIVRLGVAEHLRECGYRVVEAATSPEAKAILQAGPAIDILLCDAQMAGGESGFALAQWVRRHRPATLIMLTATTVQKAQAAHDLCARLPPKKTMPDAQGLAARIQAMLAERKRRSRPTPSSAPMRRRRRS